MKKLAVLSTAALIGLGSIAATDAEARSRRGATVAAGVFGLAAGAMLGAAAANAYAAPGYGYYGSYAPGYSYGYAPAYSYGYAAPAYGYAAPAYGYAPAYYGGGYGPVTSTYYGGGYAPEYRTTTRRVVRTYRTPSQTTRVVRRTTRYQNW